MGVAISIKLVAGLFLVPLLVVGPFARPVWDRLRVAVTTAVPLAVTGGAAAIAVGWRDPFRQAVLAQLSRPAQHDSVPRVVTLLPLPGAGVGSDAAALRTLGWIALVVFAIACAAATMWGGRDGRLWGSAGLVGAAVLMLSPSYFWHYAAMLAPAAALVAMWALLAAEVAPHPRAGGAGAWWRPRSRRVLRLPVRSSYSGRLGARTTSLRAGSSPADSATPTAWSRSVRRC